MRVPSGLADTCPLKNASYRDRARWCNVLRARREPAARKSRRSVGAWVTQQARNLSFTGLFERVRFPRAFGAGVAESRRPRPDAATAQCRSSRSRKHLPLSAASIARRPVTTERGRSPGPTSSARRPSGAAQPASAALPPSGARLPACTRSSRARRADGATFTAVAQP
jgi:hypothetical protein